MTGVPAGRSPTGTPGVAIGEELARHATAPITICWATEKADRLCGGIAPFAGHANQVEHDLGTASILARLHKISPATAACWVGEGNPGTPPPRPLAEKSPRRRDYRQPSSDQSDRIRRTVFGRTHSPFPRACRKHILSYELW